MQLCTVRIVCLPRNVTGSAKGCIIVYFLYIDSRDQCMN